MADNLNLGITALFVNASEDAEVTIINGGPGTVYYKTTDDVSSTSYDGTIADGATLQSRAPKWIVTTTTAKVFIDHTSHADDTHNVHGITDISDVAILSQNETVTGAWTFAANIELTGNPSLGSGRSIRWVGSAGTVSTVHMAENTFSGTQLDQVLFIGHNMTGSGSRINTSEHAIWLGLEYEYNTGSQVLTEWNLDWLTSAGASYRYMAWNVDHANNKSEWLFRADGDNGFGIAGSAWSQRTFQWNPGASTKTVSTRMGGAGSDVYQVGYSDDTAAVSWMSFGPKIFSNNLGLHIRAGGIVGLGTYQGDTDGTGLNIAKCTTAPTVGINDVAQIYVDESGGKDRVMVRFGSGAAQQIAIEP